MTSICKEASVLPSQLVTLLLSEQNFHQAIRIADRGYIIVHGEIVFEGNVAELEQNDLVKNYYLGTAA